MKRPVNWLRRLSVAPARASRTLAVSTGVSLIRFGACVFLISTTLSGLALPWFGMSWWVVFRRCVSIASLISLWLCIKQFEGRSFQSYGFSACGAGKRHLLFGLFIGVVALALLVGIGLACGAYTIDITPDRAKLWRTVLGFIPAAVLVSVLEELVFRGFILQHLLTAYSKTFAVLASGSLYAIVHLKTVTLTMATYMELVGLCLLGGVLALSYLRTGQLHLAVGLHAALAYGARVNKLLIGFPYPSMSWLVGTSRLVNGLIGWVILLAVGAIVLWWARSSHGGAHEDA